jgi:hypothetical protein
VGGLVRVKHVIEQRNVICVKALVLNDGGRCIFDFLLMIKNPNITNKQIVQTKLK